MESAPDAKARTACCNTVFHQERRGLEQVHLGLSRCLKSLKSLLSLILVRPKGSAKTILTGSQQFLPRDSFCSFCALLKPLRYSPAFLDQNMEKHCDLDKNRRKVNPLFHPGAIFHAITAPRILSTGAANVSVGLDLLASAKVLHFKEPPELCTTAVILCEY